MIKSSLNTPTNVLTGALLRLLAMNVNLRPGVRKYLRSADGWIDFTIGIRTIDGSINRAISFRNGTAAVLKGIPDDADCKLVFTDGATLREMINLPPNEVMNLLLKNRLITEGNMSYLQIFNFILSVLLKDKQIKTMMKQENEERAKKAAARADTRTSQSREKPERAMMKTTSIDPGVKHLEDPYLSLYSLKDFPRVEVFRKNHFSIRPEICAERPAILTDWFRRNGFEFKKDGSAWEPELRQGYAFKYLMENRKPIIAENDLIAGTTTAKPIGVVIYPDASGTLIWGELLTAPYRPLNKYDVSEETVNVLHHDVLPFWTSRNVREWVRMKYENPLCQKLDERFAVYFLWKTVALSHTICDFPKLFRLGTSGIIKEIEDELIGIDPSEKSRIATLNGMILCLDGLASYSRNLSHQALIDAEKATDPAREKELLRISEICAKVPENPCRTLDEAINCLWIGWVGVHMENTNAGFSLGRLDQWLQPFFEADISGLGTKEERDAYIKRAIELVCCFYMRCTDHLPLIPDIGNYLFGGSSSDQAITLGGVTSDGEDAVNDMTYIFLKVTEMLGIRDPNVNARYNREKNSDTYLRRLCEVNLVTTATPSIHSDTAVMKSLEEFKYPPEDLRDWSATGCVEPTLSGKHIGHTNCMMMNMVAAFEMALNNGRHPLMNLSVGPETGDDFDSFEAFFNAFTEQFRFLIDNSIEYNNMLGQAHSVLRPTPFISALIDNGIKTGIDVTKGGAKHNSSGAACIGLADITDSMMAVKKLVFDEKKVGFSKMKDAVRTNFATDAALHAMVRKKVPLFGSGSEEALEIANRITKFAHDCYGAHRNFRGGPYTSGFWSMSNHVAFGSLTGALPSGRLAGKAFTPGLTPEAHASKNLLDNVRDVSMLNPANMNNNIAFNVKVVPSAGDSHEDSVEHIYSYVKTYSDLGGMQMQFNVVSSDTLRDAMLNPENYQHLLVRISGYNAYFTTLNHDMQVELIERAEYGI